MPLCEWYIFTKLSLLTYQNIGCIINFIEFGNYDQNSSIIILIHNMPYKIFIKFENIKIFNFKAKLVRLVIAQLSNKALLRHRIIACNI